MIKTDSLTKIFRSGEKEVIALNNVNITLDEGQFILIKGHSGCGKSTLLFAFGGMLLPSSGIVTFGGVSLYDMKDRERAVFRAKHVGFVFQSYHLLPYLSVMDNILFSKRFGNPNVTVQNAIRIAEELNIAHRLNHKPSELSIGEKQRVALARVFIAKPEIILADEPTGNLDPENAREVINNLMNFNKAGGTVIMVTHGNEADSVADKILRMERGVINDLIVDN